MEKIAKITMFAFGVILGATALGANGGLAAPAIQESAAGQDSREAWLERVEQARLRYESFAARAASASSKLPQPAISTPINYLEDSTLRAGDVVVTERGLLVFKGAAHFPFAAADFEPIEHYAYAGPAPRRQVLLDIQRGNLAGGRGAKN